MEKDFVKEKVLSIKKAYAHSGVYVVTLKPEHCFPSEASPHNMSFASKQEALKMIYQAEKVLP
jgi:hypothetical protein